MTLDGRPERVINGSVSKLKRIATDLSEAPNDRFLGNICSELSSMPKIFIAMLIIHLYCF